MLSPSMGKFRCIVAGVVVSLAPMKDRIVEVKAFRLGRLVVGVDVRERMRIQNQLSMAIHLVVDI